MAKKGGKTIKKLKKMFKVPVRSATRGIAPRKKLNRKGMPQTTTVIRSRRRKAGSRLLY